MAPWHRSWRADLGLRASGFLLFGIAYAAIAPLADRHMAPQSADALSYGLAAIGFLAASAGSAMVMLGHHLFDEIEISERWRPRPLDPLSTRSETVTPMETMEPDPAVVGRDADGSWTVRGSTGALLGRFVSSEAAQRFARAERRSPAATSIATSAGLRSRIDGRLSLRLGQATAAKAADA